jgi:hypothetical protein
MVLAEKFKCPECDAWYEATWEQFPRREPAYRCSDSVAVMADQWADDVRLSDIEDRFTCTACGKRGADVRPDFNWNKRPVKSMGYR